MRIRLSSLKSKSCVRTSIPRHERTNVPLTQRCRRVSGIRRFCSSRTIQSSVVTTFVLLTAMCAGCSRTAPARFYLLNDLQGIPEAVAPKATGGPCLTLGIGPVEIPDYLDRPQIVTQVGPNELHLGDFDQWAEPLEKTFMRTLADNLASLLCVNEVVYYPSERSGVDFQVLVTVTRFQGLPDGSVVLSAQWQVLRGGRGEVLVRNRTTILERTEGPGYASLVAAQSKALAKLSSEIAEAVSGISRIAWLAPCIEIMAKQRADGLSRA